MLSAEDKLAVVRLLEQRSRLAVADGTAVITNYPNSYHYSLSAAYLSNITDRQLARQHHINDHYHFDIGHVDVAVRVELSSADHQQADDGDLLEVTRVNFDIAIPRIRPSATPYPSYTPFTDDDVVTMANSCQESQQQQSLQSQQQHLQLQQQLQSLQTQPLHLSDHQGYPSNVDEIGLWSLDCDYDDSDGQVHVYTYYEDQLHGPSYVVDSGQVKYVGSYNFGYRDGLWSNTVTGLGMIYRKGVIVYQELANGHSLSLAYPDIAQQFDNWHLLLYDPVEQVKPEVIEGVIISQQTEYLWGC